MKCIWKLSSIVLVSCLTFSSATAMSKSTEHISNQLSAQTEPVRMARFRLPRIIEDATRTIDKVNRIRLQKQRKQDALRRRQAWEEAQRAATEQQRLEAERRQQYFESLSPEQQKVYLNEQRARQAQSDKAAGLFLLWLLSAGMGIDTQGVASEDRPDPKVPGDEDSATQIVYRSDKPSRCELTAGGKTADTCNSFKILKQGKVHIFTYYLDGSPLAFFSVLVKSEGDIDAFAVGQMYVDGETHDLKEPGVCTMHRKLRSTTCLVNNFEIRYEP